MDLNTDTLESLCELVVDCPHSTPKWTDSGIIVLRNQNIKNGVLDLSKPSFTNEEDYQKRVKRAIPQAGDIVITREAPMGEVCIIPDGLKCCLGQRQVLLRPRNDICGEYLFWALQSPHVQHQISWNEGTGTTVSNVRIPVLKVLLIPRSPNSEKQSAQVLSALAKKLELNKQTNQILEQMTQTLFKSWFVNFDPVFDNLLAKVDFDLTKLPNDFPEALQKRAQKRLFVLDSEVGALTKIKAKASPQAMVKNDSSNDSPTHDLAVKIHQHFPNEFEHNEQLGWIPKGWEDGTLANVADALSGYAFKGKDFSENGSAVIKIKNISADRTVGIIDVNRVPPEIGASASRFLLNDGDIIMAMTGATVGKFGVISSESNEPYYLNQRVCKLSSKLKNGSPFLFAALNKPGVEEGIVNAAQGSAQPNISATGILATKLLVPSMNLIELFNSSLMATFERKITLRKEIYTLTKLRDTLLPKLISGELQIPDVKTTDVETA